MDQGSPVIKAFANKIAILKFAIETLQLLTFLGWAFGTKFFSALTFFYLGRLGGDRVQKKIQSRKFILSTLKVGAFESQIRELQFYLQTP